MGCFSHIKKRRKKLLGSNLQSIQPASSGMTNTVKVRVDLKVKTREEVKEVVYENAQLASNINREIISSEAKTKEEIETATRNFKADCFLGEGGFGKAYKGHLGRINKEKFYEF